MHFRVVPHHRGPITTLCLGVLFAIPAQAGMDLAHKKHALWLEIPGLIFVTGVMRGLPDFARPCACMSA